MKSAEPGTSSIEARIAASYITAFRSIASCSSVPRQGAAHALRR